VFKVFCAHFSPLPAEWVTPIINCTAAARDAQSPLASLQLLKFIPNNSL
jgi:hypothetical protein